MRTPARRFMAPQARSGNGHGYYSRPQRPLPEVADEPHILERIRDATHYCDEPESDSDALCSYTDLGQHYDRLRYLAELEQAHNTRAHMTIDQRIADLERRAKERRCDITSDLWLIRKIILRARNNRHDNTFEPPAALERVTRIEARFDWRPDLNDYMPDAA